MILTGTGGTIRLKSDLPLPTSGYYVGGGTRAKADYIGWWVDSATGLTHLDWVNWYPSTQESAARAVGQVRGEIAIYDIANDCEIRL